MKYLVSTQSQLSHALRSARKARGLSQDGAGALVGLLPKTISALENHPGSATIDSLMKLLSALGLELVLVPKETDDAGKKAGLPPNEEW
ncbi:MAG TPA: helix-turn-helix domain-containing protein [Rectinemataceae bacterium]|nr:helix-turn-helix domain-containing protein [Rectinemataceae bacterium]